MASLDPKKVREALGIKPNSEMAKIYAMPLRPGTTAEDVRKATRRMKKALSSR
jgi:bifunctional DNA-binding transcriptional regulator/antitoxin component of YhaV-PrlF toxin-antitoxin module